MPVSKAHATWNGDIQNGSGHFTAGDGITGGVTYKSRFEGGPGSNPEQLIGAAHATCFSMALANELANAGFPAESIETDASVTLRPGEGITKIQLVTEGRVPGIEAARFHELAEVAKANCPVSRALAGVPEVTLEANLASN